MQIKPFTFNPFMTNGYVLHANGEAALIDAPSARTEEHEAVLGYLEENGLTVRHLLLTHAHIDHIFGAAFLAERFGLPWQMHRADAPFVERAKEQAAMFGVSIDAAPPLADGFLEEGDTLALGGLKLDVVHTPGHSPGSVCFVVRGEDAVVSGDVLFQGSIGRTEGLPRTSLPELMASIENKLLPLGDGVRVLPGHGPATTIGREKASNPFLNGAVNLGV